MAAEISKFEALGKTYSGNAASKDVPGFKKFQNLQVNSTIKTKNGILNYVTTGIRTTNDTQGEVISTNVPTDILIDGAGYLVVKDKSGKLVYTRRGDFLQNEIGFLTNGGGQRLLAWEYDKNGDLPQNQSDATTLVEVNFANPKGPAKPTTVISLSFNINANQDALRGNGVSAEQNKLAKNSGKNAESLILPEKLFSQGGGGSSLNIGDSFNFTSTTTGITKTITYGGMVLARKPSNNIGEDIFNSSGSNEKFTFGDPAYGNLVSGQKLRIQLSNGKSYDFTADSSTQSAANLTFNTLGGLKDAINKTGAIKAEIDSEGRLYIAPLDPNSGISFKELGGGNIIDELGLVDLPQALGGIKRFNSLQSLKEIVNKEQDIYSLKATIDNNKSIKVTSLLATADFNISATSIDQKNDITYAQFNPTNDEKGRATVFISALGSNLTKGDYINIDSMGGQLPNGIYYVANVTSNGFYINLREDDPTLFPAVGDPQPAIGANATWQKTMGQQYEEFNDATVINTAAGAIRIELPNKAAKTVSTANGGENWANGDIVYISGLGEFSIDGANNVIVPDGYYQIANFVNNAGAGESTFEIIPTQDPAVAAPAAAAPTSTIVRKIGTGATVSALDNNIFTTTGGNASPDSAVRVYIPNNTYRVDDYISFAGLGAPLVIDGLTVENDIRYKITSVGLNKDYIEFKLIDPATGLPLAATTGDQSVNVQHVALGNNFAINNGSQMLKYFSIDQARTTYDRLYDPLNTDKNLSQARDNVSNFSSSLYFSVPITIYDSLGSQYQLTLYMAKLGTNQWAIELSGQKDKDGTYEILNLKTENGLIREGIMTFDTNGNLQGVPEGFEDEIIVQRNNGSAPSAITIDWLNTMSEITNGTITQNSNANNIEIFQNNGQKAGILEKLEISPSGDIVGTYDTGEIRKLYKIPIAIFPNVNGLTPGNNGTFEISNSSGEVSLKEGGKAGAGTTIGGALESSNVDMTEELINLKDNSDLVRAIARSRSIEQEIFQTVLSELK